MAQGQTALDLDGGSAGPGLARIVEPTRKLDSLGVLAEVGDQAASYSTVKRRLPNHAEAGVGGHRNAIDRRDVAADDLEADTLKRAAVSHLPPLRLSLIHI